MISEQEVRSILEKTKVMVHKDSTKVTFNVAFSFLGGKSTTYRFTKDLGREELKDRQYQIRKAV